MKTSNHHRPSAHGDRTQPAEADSSFRHPVEMKPIRISLEMPNPALLIAIGIALGALLHWLGGAFPVIVVAAAYLIVGVAQHSRSGS